MHRVSARHDCVIVEMCLCMSVYMFCCCVCMACVCFRDVRTPRYLYAQSIVSFCMCVLCILSVRVFCVDRSPRSFTVAARNAHFPAFALIVVQARNLSTILYYVVD